MLKRRQKLGKYRVEERISHSNFADVYHAYDMIEGLHVALKVPHARLATREMLDNFRREVRLAARLDHPHILPLKNAGFFEGHFVIAFPLGEETLADRLARRISFAAGMDYAEQMLEAAAFAHRQRIIHCDIKPENMILFPGGRLKLTDFGIAKVSQRTVRASGSGTLGYIAPEQAMGRPSFRSDVFSLGLILCRMVTGHLPEWPYKWPPAGLARARRRLHPDLVHFLRKSLETDPRRRFRDADQMLAAFKRVKRKALAYAASSRRRAESGRT